MTSTPLEAINQLVEIVAQLRNPVGGCPWDLAQTPQSLTPYIIEEAYEAVDAITIGDVNAICEELGDLLLQVILQSQVASDYGQFTLQEVAEGISAKLIRRHPHVFGETIVANIEEVRQNWEQIKATEQNNSSHLSDHLSNKLRKYARSLPPIEAAMKISSKAATMGFEWPDIDGVWQKFYEEIAEFQHALLAESPDRQQEELGDVLFSLLQLARWQKLDPTAALKGTNDRFLARLATMEKLSSKQLSECSLQELEDLWQQAKLEHQTNQDSKDLTHPV